MHQLFPTIKLIKHQTSKVHNDIMSLHRMGKMFYLTKVDAENYDFISQLKKMKESDNFPIMKICLV